MCLVFNRDILEDDSLLNFLATPHMKYLLRDTHELFVSLRCIHQARSRESPPPEIQEHFESILWGSGEDTRIPECPLGIPSEMYCYHYSVQFITKCAVIRRNADTAHSWKIDSCNFRQLSSFCKKLQRQIDCRKCPDFPCFSDLMFKWCQSIGMSSDTIKTDPKSNIWTTWMDTRDDSTGIDKKIAYFQDSLSPGHNMQFQFVRPSDTVSLPFQKTIRSYTEHNWDRVGTISQERKASAAKGQETKRLKKEMCPACIFADYCGRWRVRSCNGPCTKEHILKEITNWHGSSTQSLLWGLSDNREMLALVASVSGHNLSRVFRSSMTIGRMGADLQDIRLKFRSRPTHTYKSISLKELLLLLRADRGHEWLDCQLDWARKNPMSDEALAMYLELSQLTRSWHGLGCGFFGVVRQPVSVNYRGGVRFVMEFSNGYDMDFDGFGSLWRLKHDFKLWQHWKER
jgi:hypothetical protein